MSFMVAPQVVRRCRPGRLSPFLSDFERNGLLELMAATPRAPPTGRSMAPRTAPVRTSSVPEITRAAEIPNGSGAPVERYSGD